MGIEVIIYCYGAVCVGMLVFNSIYNFYLKRSSSKLEAKSRKIGRKMEEQINRVRKGDPVEEKHLEYLERKLCQVNNLIAFDRALAQFLQREMDTAETAYLDQIQVVIMHLSVVYLKKENMQAAYFAFFIAKYRQKRQMQMDSLQRVLLDYMKKDSLYCRVNALQALYAFGSVENIVEAIRLQDEQDVFFHEKILTEGLLSFQGSHRQLIELLWAQFDTFSEKTQLPILNYIRFRTGDYCQQMYEIMQDEARDKELRFAAIRYFGKYPYLPAQAPLLAFTADKDPLHWEYAAISAASLAHYPGTEVIETLKEALHSANWYVRYNAAVSLDAHHLDYSSLMDIVNENDRYAREMMMYRLDSRRLQEAERG